MKKLFVFSLLALQFMAVYAQSCDKYPITTIYANFDSITANYKQILLKDVTPEDTILPSFFKDMSRCWIDRVKNIKTFKSYSITEEAKRDYPEIVFLVFNSRSLATCEEKQNWFNLMPMMSREQMLKLYDILEREMLKINSIELKYEAKRQEIREKYTARWESAVEGRREIDPELKYFGYRVDNVSDAVGEIMFFDVDKWKLEGSEFVNERGEKYNIKDVNLIEADDFYSKKRQILKEDKKQSIFFDDYLDYCYDYLKNLKDGLVAIPKGQNAQNWIVEYWKLLMGDYYYSKDKEPQLELLASIPFEDMVSEKESSKEIKVLRHRYLQGVYMGRGDYGLAAESCVIVIDGTDTDISPQGFVFDLYYAVVGSMDKQWEKSQKKLEKAFVDLYKRIDKKEFYEKLPNYATRTSVMMIDYYLTYGQNMELKDIVQTIKAKLIENHKNNSLWYGRSNAHWYKVLNDSYLNRSFEKEMNYEELREQVNQTGVDFEEKDMVEYACYYCLYQMIHKNPKKGGNVSNVLTQIGIVCNNPSYGAYNYVEKYIAQDLYFRLMNQNGDFYPKIYVTSERLKETKLGSYPLSFWAGYGSEVVRSVKVNVNGKFNSRCKINMDDKSAWKCDYYIELMKGDNIIEIECLDAKNKSVKETIRINYKPDDYMDRKDVALLFAVDDYSNAEGYNSLKKPIKDAESFAKKLNEFGFKTIVCKNPDGREIMDTLRKYATQNYNIYDQLLVFFSGHGTVDTDVKEGFIVPADGNKDEKYRTMVSYNFIRGLLDNSNCQHILFISDACHSGSFIVEMMKNEQPQSQGSQAEIMKHKSRYFIGSALPENTSPDNSKLIKLLLEDVFNDNADDIIDFYKIQSLLKTWKKDCKEMVATDWGSNTPNSDFYFNKRQKPQN